MVFDSRGRAVRRGAAAERWDTNWQTNYDLTPQLYTFGVIYSQALTSSTTLTDKLLVESGSSDTLETLNLVYAF